MLLVVSKKCLVLVLILFFFVSLKGASSYATPIKIVTISDVMMKVQLNDKINLPKTVKAIMSDKSKRDVMIKWENKRLHSTKVGVLKITGTVVGYSKKVNLIITIVNNTSAHSPSVKEPASEIPNTLPTSHVQNEKQESVVVETDIGKRVKYLSDKQFGGRKPGTIGYKSAVDYLAMELRNEGLEAIFNSDLIQSYDTSLTTLTFESLFINEKKLDIMSDYMPFSRSSNGTFDGERNVVFVGDGTERSYNNISAMGKTVIFTYYDHTKKFPMGLLDRVLIAKSKGATEVLIVCNGELKVGNYEHPLNNNNVGLYVQYLSEKVTRDLGIIDYSKPKEFALKLRYNFEVERIANIESQNIVGQIKGRNPSKTILLSTNLDGFGKLPDGTVYQNAKLGLVSPAMFVDLVKYYKKNQPLYNIVFVVVGSKWDSQKGIDAVLSRISENDVITAIDLYAMGGKTATPYIGCSPKTEDFLLKNVVNPMGGTFNRDFGNALAHRISAKIPNTIMIRGNGTWVDDAKTDTWQNVDFRVVEGEKDYLIQLITKISKTYSEKEAFQYVLKSKIVDNAIAGVQYKNLESKYFNILYDNSYEQTVATNAFLKECDKIYERISYYNYFPEVPSKPLLIISNNTIAAAKIADRKDIYEGGHNVGGGFASFPNSTKNVIYCKQPSLYTVAHESNHWLAGMNIKNSYFVTANQEAQGQFSGIFYSDTTFLEDANRWTEIVQMSDPIIGKNNQLYVAKTYKESFSWEWFSDTQKNPYKFQNSYFTLGSMFSFLNYNYGPAVTRRAIYRLYEATSLQGISSSLIQDTGLTEAQFLEKWSKWIISGGKEPIKPTAVSNDLNSFDLKWNTNLVALDKDYWQNYQNTSIGVEKTPNLLDHNLNDYSVAITQLDDSSDDNVVYQDVYHSTYDVRIGDLDDSIFIKVKFENIKERESIICIFFQGDLPGLKEVINFQDNSGTLIFKMKKSEVITYKAGIAINLGDRNFIFIDKKLLYSLCK